MTETPVLIIIECARMYFWRCFYLSEVITIIMDASSNILLVTFIITCIISDDIYLFKIDKIQLFIIFYLLLNVLFIFAAFMLSMENVEWQVRVGLKRVMFESSGFYLLTIVYLFNKVKKNDTTNFS